MESDIELKEQIRLISKLTQEEKFCIDGYIANGSKTVAYMCSRKKESQAQSRATITTMAHKFFNRPEVIAYLTMRENDLMNGCFIRNKKYGTVPMQLTSNELDKEEQEAIDKIYNDGNVIDGIIAQNSEKCAISSSEPELSKEKLLQTLTKLFLREKDTKLKAELGLKIADLNQWKKEQTEKEDTTTKFYLPIKCFNCKLYKDFKAKKSK